MNPRAFQIHSSDSVAVLLDDAQPGPVSLRRPPDPLKIFKVQRGLTRR
jgi:hypothetical protein